MVDLRRADGVSTVRSVVPLCRVPLIQCPVSITGTLLDPRAATVRHPIRVAYCIRSHSRETIELTASFDLADVFMFCGEKRKDGSSVICLQKDPVKVHMMLVQDYFAAILSCCW
ncbi:hypothetical protein ANCCAN_19715 [Ancylostoma caninum]|uniref:Uncharacterized protein n=1 Tax=Ancylostoma caninum TaxID=29170 RepID=A0A368FUH5_ANCCA|nr:hypothetical protein ANCCAN_19715 [Ancylostoma caninum]